MIGILCSGQGGQHRGMFALTADRPEAAAVFAGATDALGQDPRRFVETADDAALFANRAGQILCCTQALAVWRALGAARPARAVIGGYSVGELAAWGCAGALDDAAIIGLAAARADAMDAAAPPEAGLAAIVGLPPAAIRALADDHQLHIAIRNGDDSVVLGGLRPALERACESARRQGAQRAVMLPVAVPSHTPLMHDAVAPFLAALRAASPRRPEAGLRLLSGIDAEPVTNADDGCRKLAAQIAAPIDWAGCVQSCREAGARTLLELGPGNALSRMAGAMLPDATVRASEDFRSLEGLAGWVGQAR